MPNAPTPLRILQYSPGMRLELGGVVRAVLDSCSVLARRGHEVILVTYDAPDIPGDWNGQAGKPAVVNIPQARRPNGRVNSSAVQIWDRLLTPGSVAHLHCPWTASNVQMARAARERGVPYIVSIHGMLDDWSMSRGRLKKQLFLAAGGRKYLRQARRLHFTADAERDQAMKWIPRETFDADSIVLPYLVDLSSFEHLPGPAEARSAFPILEGDEPKVLFLSRLHEQKGLDLLIEAAALLRQAGSRFKLLVAGSGSPGYELSLRQLVDRLGLGEVVSFAGLVTGTRKISLYQSVDVFVLPTRHENLGLVLVEALAAGTPVVTTRGTDFWQEIASAGGIVVDATPQAIYAALGQMLKDRPSLSALGLRGREWVMDRFNQDRLSAEYERMYRDLMAH